MSYIQAVQAEQLVLVGHKVIVEPLVVKVIDHSQAKYM
jgi:hypothetical protein